MITVFKNYSKIGCVASVAHPFEVTNKIAKQIMAFDVCALFRRSLCP